MSIYKYVISDRFNNILKDGLIRFTQANDLNDPWEMKPNIEQLMSEETFEIDILTKAMETPEELVINELSGSIYENLNRKGILLTPQQVRALVEQSIKENPDEFKAMRYAALRETWRGFKALEPSLVSDVLKAFHDNFGILSLTEKPNNKLMWAHYAGNHTGIVIEFDSNHPFFAQEQDNNSDITGLHKIIYSDERPRIEEFKSLLDTDSNFSSLFFTKGLEWEYEQEWRMIKHFKQADTTIDEITQKIYLFKIPMSCISGLILGCRMSEQCKQQIIDYMKDNPQYSHITLSHAVMNEKSYDLEIVSNNLF